MRRVSGVSGKCRFRCSQIAQTGHLSYQETPLGSAVKANCQGTCSSLSSSSPDGTREQGALLAYGPPDQGSPTPIGNIRPGISSPHPRPSPNIQAGGDLSDSLQPCLLQMGGA